MYAEKLRNYLEEEGVKYVSFRHSRAYTMQEVAALSHISGKLIAKTVMVKADGKMIMVALPANDHVDMESLKEVSGAAEAVLADEGEFVQKFPDCEIGAMPPFGNLYGMDVYMSKALMKEEEIYFNAGCHSEMFRLPASEFIRLVRPVIF